MSKIDEKTALLDEMRIAIDAFKQVKGVGKSVGIYNLTVCLVRYMIEYQKNTDNKLIKESRIIVFGNECNREDFDLDGVDFIIIKDLNPLNKTHCIWWELFRVSKECVKAKADKVMFPRGYNALTHPVKDIVTINDLIPYFYKRNFPHAFNKIENAYIMHRLKTAAKSSYHIITLSQASKDDIVKTFRINPDKVSIIHCGLTDTPHTINPNKPQYICAGASKLPHKNALGVIKAYVKYCEIESSPLPLVITGIEDTSDYYELPQSIRDKITCVKFVKDNNKFYSYTANATLFVYLSLIEGFGFPPIEAMQMGVPVVCSNRTSIPEAVGDAAIIVDPDDSLAVARAIQKLANDKKLQTDLIDKGGKNIQRFTWDKTAKKYWEVFIK